MNEFGRTDLVTVRKAATCLNRSDRTIRRLVQEDKLRAVWLGAGKGQLYIEVTSLRDYAANGNQIPTQREAGDGE